jgi:beta-xylosidase
MGAELKCIQASGLLLMAAALAAGSRAVEPAGRGFDVPLRAASICRAPDGVYYLTGTTKINTRAPKYADFQNNDGVRLWKSADLKTWEPVGLVWDLSKTGGRDAEKSGWQAHLRSVPGQPDREWSRGVTAPELRRVKGTWWIVFALNDQDIGLLKSRSGKPEGPYEEIGRLNNRFLGGDGSLFEDTDGKVYLVWGGGYIARMRDDMSDVAEEPKALQTLIQGYPIEEPAENQMHERGAFVFKDGKTYRYIYAAWHMRDGKAHFDTLACEAKALLGPYSKPKVLIPDGGQAAVFRDGDGTWKAVYSRGDRVKVTVIGKGGK